MIINILTYFQRKKYIFLVLGSNNSLSMSGYSDVTFQTNPDNFCSQYGWIFLFNGGAVMWKSFKMSMMDDFTCELEYIATSNTSKQGAWLKD